MQSLMRVAVGADKRGIAVRDHIHQLLQGLGHEVELVEEGEPSADYPDIAARVARQVEQGRADRGILIARTGMGMCIMANKFPGIRAAVCYDEFMAEMSRRYLDVNVLCLSAELSGMQPAARMVEIWLGTPFEGGRHAKRIERIKALASSAGSGSGEPAERGGD